MPQQIILHVSLEFVNYPDPQFNTFASRHVTCMTGNLAFPDPTVKPADVETLRAIWYAADLAAANGGSRSNMRRREPKENPLQTPRFERSKKCSLFHSIDGDCANFTCMSRPP
jgi:hypothetical protein